MSRKLSIEELVKPRTWISGDQFTERPLLDPKSQAYLIEYLKTSPDAVGVYEHSRPTKTCKEKIELLNTETQLTWKLEQAVRAVYFKGPAGFIHMIVTPDYDKGRIDTTPIFGRTLGLATELPDYVEQGTCTPFIPDWDISCAMGRVQAFYVHDAKGLDQTLCDFSIGGRGPDAQKCSLRIHYGIAVDLLKKQFEDLVTVQDIYTMPAKQRYTPGSKVLKPTPDKVQA